MRNGHICTLCGALLAAALTGGCGTVTGTGAPVVAGEPLSLEYSCRLGDGSLVASSRADASAGGVAKRSEILVPPRTAAPVPVIAGKGLRDDRPASTRSFEDEISVQLAKKTVGLSTGSTLVLEIRGDGTLAADGLSHKLPMAAVRTRLKELHLDRTTYRTRIGKEPEVGQAYLVDPLIPGKVESVQGDDVLIRFSAAAGTEITTPFGKGVIRETPENYEIALFPQLGSLVRTGPIVGRISQVNERQFVIDYSDPFGGEALSCAVRLERQQEEREAGQAKAGR